MHKCDCVYSSGDVEGLKRGKPLRCYELTPNKISGDGLREFNACNPT